MEQSPSRVQSFHVSSRGAVISGESEGVVTNPRSSLQGKKVRNSVAGHGRKGLQYCVELM